MSEHLDAAQAWAREAHGRLAEATAAHAAELERVRAGAAREREELRGALESRAQVLEESRGELRARPSALNATLTPRGPS